MLNLLKKVCLRLSSLRLVVVLFCIESPASMPQRFFRSKLTAPNDKRFTSTMLIVSACNEGACLQIQCCQNILYFGKVKITCILYLSFFQSYTLKILYYRIKLSRRIKSTFFLEYLIYVSSLSTNEHIKKNLLVPSMFIYQN